MRDVLRIDSDYNVYYCGKKIGRAGAPRWDQNYHPGMQGVEGSISFALFELPPEPPPAPKRKASEAFGLRRPK